VTPLANPRSDRVRAVRSLARRSVRDRTGRFLAEGPQVVREAVRYAAAEVVEVFVTAEARGRHTDVVNSANTQGIPVHQVTDEVLAAMANAQVPQGVVAVCRVARPALEEVLLGRPGLLVVLAHVRDPGNAGTVIRGADAAGADAVLVSSGSVDVHNPKTVRSTAGSLFHLPVVTAVALETLLPQLRTHGIRVLAADGLGPQTLGSVDLAGPHAWVMGNEAWGLPADLREACDAVVRVPIYGKAESLNLAMAATVCLYASATAQRAG
jgi:TrmH family RNA methyltransferase